MAYLLLIGGTADGMVLPETRLASLGIGTIAFLGWGAVIATRGTWLPRSLFLPVLAGSLASMGASAVLSRSPRVALESVAQAVILGAGYLLLVELLRRKLFRDRILFAAAAIGVFVSVAYLVTIVEEWLLYWNLVGGVSTPPLRPDYTSLVYGNPSPMLGMAVLLGGVAVVEAHELRSGHVIAGVVATLALVAAVLTGTRGGWIGIAGAVLVCCVIALSRRSTRSTVANAARQVLASRGIKVGAAASVVLVLVLAVSLGPGLMRRLLAGGEDVRLSFLTASGRMLSASPLFGVGPGIWPFDRAINTLAGEADFFVASAHDLYVQTTASMGIIGFGVAVLAAGWIVWLLRDGLLDPSPWRRRWAWLATFGSVYFGLHGLLDYQVSLPASILAAVLPIAVLDATAVNHPLKLPIALAPNSRLAALPIAAAVAAAVGFACWTTPSTVAADNAARLADAGNWPGADVLAQEAATRDPSLPEYQFLAGLTGAHVGDNSRALADLNAFANFADMPEAWVDVAQLRLEAGDKVGASDALSRAARLGNQHPALGVAIADVALRTGDTLTATAAAASAVALTPSLIADPTWSSDPAWQAIYPTVLREAIQRATSDSRWEIDLMAGLPGNAISDARGSSDPDLSRDIISSWTGDQASATKVFDRCDRAPLSGPIGWCARLADHLAMTTRADRYRRLAQMLRIDPDETAELRMFPSLDGSSQAGDVSNKAGGIWRDLIPWDVLVPGIKRVDVAP